MRWAGTCYNLVEWPCQELLIQTSTLPRSTSHSICGGDDQFRYLLCLLCLDLGESLVNLMEDGWSEYRHRLLYSWLLIIFLNQFGLGPRLGSSVWWPPFIGIGAVLYTSDAKKVSSISLSRSHCNIGWLPRRPRRLQKLRVGVYPMNPGLSL